MATSLKVTKLTPNKEYKFRVRAVNKEGDGPNLETSHATVAKNPYDEPSQPGEPEITDWDSVRKLNLNLIFQVRTIYVNFTFFKSRIELIWHGKLPKLTAVLRSKST